MALLRVKSIFFLSFLLHYFKALLIYIILSIVLPQTLALIMKGVVQIDLQSWLRPALGKSKVLEHLNLKSRPKHLVCKINDL